MVAACFARRTGSWVGSTAMVDTSRTRSVAAAAYANVDTRSWLGYATRSPTASAENGPSSIRRHHSRIVGPSTPTTNDGRVIPNFMQLRVLGDVLEGGTLVGVGLLGQTEGPLADDVALHLVGAAIDRRAGREQHHLLLHPAAGTVLAHDRDFRAEHLRGDLPVEPEHVAHH